MPEPTDPRNRANGHLVWHALDRTEVEAALQTSAEGLSTSEARARVARYGPNQLAEAPPSSNLAILLHQFKSPLIYILVAAALVTLVLGEYVDAGVITAVLLLNAAIGFTQERRAENSVRALMRLAAPRARVIRAEREWELASRELVPGDLVLLESGSRVPADLRLISATMLRIDESLLTGESLPVTKQVERLSAETPVADRVNMAYMGAIVTSGRGRGYVVATGAATELGSIAERVREEERATTPMQRRMDRFARIVGVVVAAAAGLAFSIGATLGESPAEMFMVAVALAVAAVPEGLPVVFTITLAVGVRRMARRHVIVRRLPAVETLGSTTTIGSDKTGTLTENRMTVQEIWAGGRSIAIGSDRADASGDRLERGSAADRPAADPLYLTLVAGVLASEAEVYRKADDFETRGDPTEAALLIAAARRGLEPAALRAAYPSYAEVPFESERQYSASIREWDGEHREFVKGAPERVVGMCTRMLTGRGPVALDVGLIEQSARAMAGRGLRVLAMACRSLPERLPTPDDAPEPAELTFLGLQGMMDPPRPGVREAVAGCQNAGIRVVMITGDHGATARAIGRDLGIATDDAPVLTGVELESMDDELRRQVRRVSIYARVTPEHKLRVVRALQSHGEVVAVTGDGVNDAAALKAADIGVAMGRSGTDVAREASDMVLTDDNFVSIFAAVEEGRITFDNVRKVTFFLVSTGAAAIVSILATLVLGWPLPFVPAQLLWLNLVTNGLQDVALAFEPGERGVLERPPRPRDEGVISALLWERTVVAGLVMAVGTLLMFRWELDQTGSLVQAQTVALTTMVLFQNFHVGNARSELSSALRINPLSNPFLLASVAAALGVHVAALYPPPMQFILRVEPLALEAWVRMVLVASTILVAMELHKLIRRRATPTPRDRYAVAPERP